MPTSPYFRIYRPFTNLASNKNLGQILYAEDTRFCDERIQLIRMYKMLQNQVIETFQYIEPVQENENTYSLRYHQLYGNICAEIETNFRGILKTNGYSRGDEDKWNIERDYFKTNSALKLNEYIIESYYYEIVKSCTSQPFADWGSSTFSSLKWYQEHNAVKHYRSDEFKNANLKNVITALSGLYILLFSQFGFLVNSVVNNEVIYYFGDNGNGHIVPGNDMGYNFTQAPTWQDSEKYDFNWDEIKSSSSIFSKYLF